MTAERPTMLTVLCVLSWIYMALLAYNIIFEMSSGRLTDEDIRVQELAIIEAYTAEDPELLETGKWVVTESVAMLKITQSEFVVLNVVNIIGLLVGLAGVFLMFQLRKLGFHLYILYSLISIGYWTYFFGSFTIGMTIAVLSGLVGGVFVLLYSLQLKHMS